ncbi:MULTISPECIES: hypothetical protein [Bacillus]|nr:MULTISPECIES: hypothetical protein [Bacillus]KMM60804.1 hypothetical protein ACH95_08535 [Bacillus glycinifermentans]MEC0476011.1 hypothetical protein [Bacillus licheniformis]MEC0495889.1 hypothetical protein [Bacillus glycinifermentans]MEC0542616.1 hypothetical protein [Bacillus glycinifermentans]
MCEITDWGSAFYAFVETVQKYNLPFPEDAADWSTAKLIAEIERINKGEMGLLKRSRRLRQSNRKERKA